jgi:aryl-phospho-beta-D-glucosidase BglC (GH1 family)
LLVLLALLLGLIAAPSASARSRIHVEGNHLVWKGHNVRLLGVNRSGTEYACIQGWGIFDGPNSDSSISTIRSWHTNAVRVPLNEDCWLGINGDADGGAAPYSGQAYRDAIANYVQRLANHGLFVILDMHVSAPGTHRSEDINPMADADHAQAFWTSVATRFKAQRRTLFDLYNEPHDISWSCWQNGCSNVPAWNGTYNYTATGMTQLVAAVRSTGARNPILLGGVGWSGDPTQWLAHRPYDPRHQTVVSEHTYEFNSCGYSCRVALAQIHKKFPVVIGEMGDDDCNHDYIDWVMGWADRKKYSYLAWTWNSTDSGWSCNGGPALIKSYDGTPTGYGIGLRNHLRALAR